MTGIRDSERSNYSKQQDIDFRHFHSDEREILVFCILDTHVGAPIYERGFEHIIAYNSDTISLIVIWSLLWPFTKVVRLFNSPYSSC